MKKYLTLFINSLQNSTAYQLENFNWFLIATVSTISSLVVFNAAVSANAFNNYTNQQITLYIVLSLVLNRFLDWYFAYRVSNDVRHGTISSNIIAPINTKLYYFVEELGGKVIMTLPYLLFILLIILTLKISLNFNFSLFAISLTLGSLLNIFITGILASTSFWYIKNVGIIGNYQFFAMYLSGRAFPLDILPNKIFNILQFTPFPYTYFYSITSVTKGINLNIIFIQIFWVVVLYFIYKFMWKKGIKQYEAVGS